LSIVCDLERTNQLNLLPDQDLVDLCLPIESYQVTKNPFYFKPEAGYFSGRDQLFPGEIWRRDRKAVAVQCVHKTMEDYFTSLRLATFTKMPEVYELKINQKHLELDPEFFTPLIDLPLHVAFKIQK